MATELAKAYVQIIPTATGIEGKLTQELGGAADAAGEKAGSSLGSKLGGALSTAAKAGLAAVTAATGAVAGFAKSAVDVGATFDASMSQVAAVSGATGEDFDALRAKAQEMGSATKFSASEAADAMNYMAMAGWKTSDMLGGIEGIMNLAAASGESLATTSDIVTDALTAFGMTADDSGRFADVLAAASSNANTNVGMMGETFKYVAPLAGALNYSAEDTATAIGLMANAGIKGSQAGTSLRSILTRLAKPTKESQTAMDLLGLSMYDEEGKARSLAEMMDQMREGFSNLSMTEENYYSLKKTWDSWLEDGIVTQKEYNEQMGLYHEMTYGSTESVQAMVAAMLGGQEAMSGLLAIVNAAPEDYDKLTDAIYNSDGAAAQMAATMQDNLAGDITIMKSALEGAKIAVSDQLTPALREFVQFGTDGISELTTAFQEGGLSGAMEALGGILSDGLAMITEKMPEFVEAGMGLLSALGQGIMDNLPLLLDTATQIIVSMAGYIIQALPDIVRAGMELIVTLATGIADALPELIPTIVDVILEIVDVLTDPDNLSALIDASIAIILAIAEGLIDSLPKLLEKAPEILENLMRALIENVPKLLKAALEMILKIREGLIENLPKILAAAGNIIEELLKGLIEFGAQLLQTGMELVTMLIEGIKNEFTKLVSAGKEIVTMLIEGIKNEFTKLVSAGKEIVDTVKNGFKQKLEDAKNWGRDLINNFINGIKEKWNNLKSSISDIAGGVKSFLGFSEPEEGPLSDFHTYAPDMMALFAKGIRDNRGLVTDALEDSFSFTGVRSPAFAMAGAAPMSGPAWTPAAGAGAENAADAARREIIDVLSHIKVVLSTGQTVGALTVPLNNSLGDQYTRNRRGI